MDTAHAVLADVRSLGVEIISAGGVLRWRPAFLVNVPLQSRLTSFKTELAELLARGEPTDRCPSCRWHLDAKGRCPKCFDRRCADCPKQTGSYFIMRCFACGHRLERQEAQGQ